MRLSHVHILDLFAEIVAFKLNFSCLLHFSVQTQLLKEYLDTITKKLDKCLRKIVRHSETV